MVLNGNCGAGTLPAPFTVLVSTAEVGIMPVCGAMHRNHLIKELAAL